MKPQRNPRFNLTIQGYLFQDVRKLERESGIVSRAEASCDALVFGSLGLGFGPLLAGGGATGTNNKPIINVRPLSSRQTIRKCSIGGSAPASSVIKGMQLPARFVHVEVAL